MKSIPLAKRIKIQNQNSRTIDHSCMFLHERKKEKINKTHDIKQRLLLPSRS